MNANKSTCYKPSLRVPQLDSTELRVRYTLKHNNNLLNILKNLRNYPSYMLGRSTTMTSKLWNLTRVTVREKTDNKNEVDKKLLEKELSNLW